MWVLNMLSFYLGTAFTEKNMSIISVEHAWKAT